MQATETSVPGDPPDAFTALATMGLLDLDAFIDQASDPGTPLPVFLAALDRYTVLTTATRRNTSREKAAPHEKAAPPEKAAPEETAPEEKPARQEKPADA